MTGSQSSPSAEETSPPLTVAGRRRRLLWRVVALYPAVLSVCILLSVAAIGLSHFRLSADKSELDTELAGLKKSVALIASDLDRISTLEKRLTALEELVNGTANDTGIHREVLSLKNAVGTALPAAKNLNIRVGDLEAEDARMGALIGASARDGMQGKIRGLNLDLAGDDGTGGLKAEVNKLVGIVGKTPEEGLSKTVKELRDDVGVGGASGLQKSVVDLRLIVGNDVNDKNGLRYLVREVDAEVRWELKDNLRSRIKSLEQTVGKTASEGLRRDVAALKEPPKPPRPDDPVPTDAGPAPDAG